MSFFVNPGNVFRAEAQHVKSGDVQVIPLQNREVEITSVRSDGHGVSLFFGDGTQDRVLPRSVMLIKRANGLLTGGNAVG